MENTTNKPGMGSFILKYGALIGAAQIVLLMVFYIGDISPLKPGVSIINMVLVLAINILFLRAGIRKYRESILEGRIDFLKAFLLGLLTLIVGGIISGAFSYWFYNYFEPDLMMNYAAEMIDSLADKLPEDQLEMMEERILRNLTPARQLRQTLINIPVSSIILSVLVALFIKKDTTLPE